MCFWKKKKEVKKEEIKKEKIETKKEVKSVTKAPAKKAEPKKTEAKKVKPAATKPASKSKKIEKPAASKATAKKPAAKKEEKPAKKSVYRVVFDKEDNLWKIKKDGANRVIDSRQTKEEALARVQELSESRDTKFVVYKKDGKFQKKANLNLK